MKIAMDNRGIMAQCRDNGWCWENAYGVDNQRVSLKFYTGHFFLQTTKYFATNYEKEVTSAQTREINYISTPYGTLAAYIKEDSGAGQLYYLYKDHLGSITAITNAAGAVVERRSFDAWGRLRNPDDWSFNGTFAMTILDRGYTGHEHLPEFGLINMNGRLYDPIVGRMLSPDPYVQGIAGTQGFNRYSYASNNPLKYTDPTGEFLYLDLGFGWSQKGGFSISVGFGVGFKNGLSAGVYMGYEFGSKSWNFGATASFAGSYVSAGYNTQSGWNVGTGYSYGFQYGIFSFSYISVGGNYSENGGFSTNVGWINYNQHSGFSMNPNLSVGIRVWDTENTGMFKGKNNRSRADKTKLPKTERLDDYLYYRYSSWSRAKSQAEKLSMDFAAGDQKQFPVEVSTYRIRDRGYYVLEPLGNAPDKSRNHLSINSSGKTVLSGSDYEVLEQIHFSYNGAHYGSWEDAALCDKYQIPVTHFSVRRAGNLITEFYPNDVNLQVIIKQEGSGSQWFYPINEHTFRLR